ncbi:hypothetical protein T01_2481 [Trichinella spiralis]|uniref:Uncharacterized protein n=1 Tax=Trichinella spiralis TaxID=6334 RepID=A0A0V1ANZ4_TRISP|nr:hypothetical protein T01_2481 [Trichinella spiralis]
MSYQISMLMLRIEVAMIKIHFDAANRFHNKDALNSEAHLKTTYRLTIGDIEEVTSSYFLTDDLHINYYEDNILKSRSSSWKSNNRNGQLHDIH